MAKELEAKELGRRRGRGPRRAPAKGRVRDVYAALDLGTNNCRLLVAHPTGEGFRVVDAFSRIVRLGEGLSQNGRLSETAMLRTIEALRICAAKMRKRGVTNARAVATEACRRARNCRHFVERVEQDTGVRLEIISNNEEASLGLYGCAPLLDPEVPNALIFDIGGGSTEISWLKVYPGDGPGAGWRRPPPEIIDWLSIPLGVVTLTERYGGMEVPPEAYQAMIAEVAESLAPFEARHGLAERATAGVLQMLGTSGTVTTLSGIEKKLPRYDRSRVDGSYLGFDSVEALSGRIATMSYDQRAGQPCIGADRADLVVAGCAILEAICRTWPVGRLRVADRGLREGILFSLIRQDRDRRGPGQTGGRGRARGAWTSAAE